MTQSECITGTSKHLLFSPKGGIEGVLVKVGKELVQITVDPGTGPTLARLAAPGKRVKILASPERSPKTKHAAHPVFKFESFADANGHALELPEDDLANVTVKGIVASIHYARHGQPNGVVLESGEFVHLRPDGMQRVELPIGSKITAIGAVRMTVLGTRLVEAHRVNRIDLK
jgi:hypothetical protein